MKTTQQQHTRVGNGHKKLLDKNGFSLIEMAIVLAITGLVAAIAVPNIIAQLPTRQLNQTVWNLNSKLRLARTQSMSQGINTEVTYDWDSRTFEFWADEDSDGLRDRNELSSNVLSRTHGLQIFTYPDDATGKFAPDGTFTVDYDYSNFFVIIMEAKGSSQHYYLYVWPTGQVTVHRVDYDYT